MQISFNRSNLLTSSVCVPIWLLSAVLLTAYFSTARAQTTVGQISGTVADVSGAVIPGVTITITSEATQLMRNVASDDNGFYIVTNLAVGSYSVSVERQNFKKAVKTGYNLVADGRLTVDFTLEPGDVSETVLVTAAVGETVNTTSGEVARVIDGEQVRNLALNQRNYSQLTTLIPGAPLTTFDPIVQTTNLTFSQSINGNRGNTNNVTIDGGFNLVKGNNQLQSHNVGIDFIQEIKVQSSNFSAEYGRQSGAAVSIVTRSGGNRFTGSAFEFLRNDVLDARNFFSPEVRKLRFNDFGYAIGGPLIKNKFFFFGGQEWKYIRRQLDPVLRSLPSSAESSGDFSIRLRGADGIVGTTDDGFLRDPQQPANLCQAARAATANTPAMPAVRTGCFPGNIIPANRIAPDGRAITNVYRTVTGLASSFVDTPTANNAVYQLESPFDFRQDILRLDYRFNDQHSVFGRYLHDVSTQINPFGTGGSPLPSVPSNRPHSAHSLQVSHTWLINPQLINEAKINYARLFLDNTPVGAASERATYNFTFPQLFADGRFPDGIPDVTLAGAGNLARFRGPSPSLVTLAKDLSISNNLTIIRGKHTLKTGVLFFRTLNDQEGFSTSFYTGVITFNPTGNPNSTGNAFADALLGNFRTYSEVSAAPLTSYFSNQLEAYVSDSWKVKPRLSLELGFRYQDVGSLLTKSNQLANFDPSRYDPARAVRVNRNGTLTPGIGDRFNGLVRVEGGSSNRADVQAVPSDAPRGFYDLSGLFAPRLSFAYSPFEDNKTAIRGGFGVFFNSPTGTLTLQATENPPYVNAAQFENQNLTSLTTATLIPFGTVTAVDPNLKSAYSMNFSLSVQRELPHGFFLEAAYVGNIGRHLIRRPDINQASFAALAANSALPTNQQAAINFLRPYQGFSEIVRYQSDANSNYNALQLYLTKRKGNLTLTGSYTFSKALTEASNQDDGSEDSFNRRFNYGPADFDRRHILVSTYTYSLPLFHESSGIVRALFSGYELSGITRFQSGSAFTVTGNTSIGGRRADYIGGEVNLPNGERNQQRWFNTNAFADATRNPELNGRRGTAGVGIVRGPGLQQWDVSLRRRFVVTEDFRLLLQADLFNAFNRANFLGLSTNVSSIDFGSVTSAAPGRNVQFGLKLLF